MDHGQGWLVCRNILIYMQCRPSFFCISISGMTKVDQVNQTWLSSSGQRSWNSKQKNTWQNFKNQLKHADKFFTYSTFYANLITVSSVQFCSNNNVQQQQQQQQQQQKRKKYYNWCPEQQKITRQKWEKIILMRHKFCKCKTEYTKFLPWLDYNRLTAYFMPERNS